MSPPAQRRRQAAVDQTGDRRARRSTNDPVGAIVDEQDTALYSVVVNDEDQYSIWLTDREIPAGWHAVGFTGPKDECLAHIDRVWTDMRPRSLRQWIDEQV
jgi:MbtH protein